MTATLTTILALAAAGWAVAAIVMAALWIVYLRIQRGGLAQSAWPLVTAALAVVYANVGGGAPARRSAIAWMIGSWGARLGVYWVWDRVLSQPECDSESVVDGDPERVALHSRESLLSYERTALVALFFSLPAIFVSIDPEEALGIRELIASALWVVGFAGETTADRQLVRWRRANHAGDCADGVWRYVPRAHDVFETVTWSAHALFAFASPFGWIAIACPAIAVWRAGIGGTRRAQH